MAIFYFPPPNVGPITCTQTSGYGVNDYRTETLKWPYFIYDYLGRRASQRANLSPAKYTEIYKRPVRERNNLDFLQVTNEGAAFAVLHPKMRQLEAASTGCYFQDFQSAEALYEYALSQGSVYTAEYLAGLAAYLSANPWYLDPALRCTHTSENNPSPPTPTLIPITPTTPLAPLTPVTGGGYPLPRGQDFNTDEFIATASFKAGTDAKANADGARDFTALATKTAKDSKLTAAQTKKLLGAVNRAIASAKAKAKKKPLAKPKGRPNTRF